MHMKRTVALLSAAVVGLSFAASAQQQALTTRPMSQVQRRRVSLREAMRLAASQGPDVAAARAQAAVVRVSVEKAWTVWQPDLVATGTFDHTSAPSEIPAGALGPGSPAVTLLATNSRYGTLQLSQPLLTPQGLFLPGIANAAAEAAAHGADDAREQILLQVARAYTALQGLEGQIKAARDAEQVALRREQDARAQINAGTAVELALLRAQTETAAARVRISDFEGNKQALLPLLEALVGEAVEPLPIGPEEELQLLLPTEPEPWESNYGVRSAIAAVTAAQRSTRLDRFLWLPSVAAVAKGSYNSNGGFAGTDKYYDLIINISVPLYDRGQRYAQLHEDEARLQQAQAQLASARARAKALWDAARANLVTSQVSMEQANIASDLAVKQQQQVEASYRAGVATSLDLSDADQRKFLAQATAAQARAEVEQRKAELAASISALYRSAQ
jgi:outer membrane protein TolC